MSWVNENRIMMLSHWDTLNGYRIPVRPRARWAHMAAESVEGEPDLEWHAGATPAPRFCTGGDLGR